MLLDPASGIELTEAELTSELHQQSPLARENLHGTLAQLHALIAHVGLLLHRTSEAQVRAGLGGQPSVDI